MKIYLGCDHGAFDEKERVKSLLLKLGHDVEDLGTHSSESTNYPIYAKAVAESIQKDMNSRGVLLCGSGIGVSIVANRFSGIRAALCHSVEDAKLSRQHNNSNIICFGARTTKPDLISEMLKAWLETPFEGGRHSQRIALFDELGEKS